MSTVECHQESFYCYGVFIVVCFVLFQYQVLPQTPELSKKCQAWFSSHVEGLKSNQILVSYTHSFVPSLQSGHHCKLKDLWLGWCLHFSFGSMQSTFLYQSYQHVVLKALCRHQLDFFLFNVQVLSSAMGSCCQPVQSNLQSWQQIGLFGISHGASLANSPIMILETSWVTRDGQLEFSSPIIW